MSRVGRLLMKPTVSVSRTSRPLGRRAARRGIEGGEELVLGQDRRAGQRVEERALAGVGVADEGDDWDRHVAPRSR